MSSSSNNWLQDTTVNRIDFKILLLTYKAINGSAPFYLQELIYLKEECKYKLRSVCDGPSELKTVSLSRIACDNLVNNDGTTIYNSDEKSDIS